MFEVQEDYAAQWMGVVVPIMEGAVKLSVPVVVDCEVGYAWGDMQEVDWRAFNLSEWQAQRAHHAQRAQSQEVAS